jgi:hypothetical protein
MLLLEVLAMPREEHEAGGEELRALIAGAGLEEEDLHDLLTWLGARDTDGELGEAWLSARRYARASEGSLRLMGQREDELLTVPAFDYLLRLVRTGQITSDQMESLIQFAQIAPGGPLTPGDLTPLLDRVVFSDRRDDSALGPERTH